MVSSWRYIHVFMASMKNKGLKPLPNLGTKYLFKLVKTNHKKTFINTALMTLLSLI